MDYSAANIGLWSPIVQLGIIAMFVLIANIIRVRVPLIKKTMIPTAVLAGFIMLFFKLIGVVHVSVSMLECLTYHGIAIGFIALSLRTPEKTDIKNERLVGVRSGAVIVGSYMIQAIVGLIISIGLALTIKPDMFTAAGILLPMGYGQGPGQANNIGNTYEALGFMGGHSFGISIAAMGYICACIVGVYYINRLVRTGKIERVNHDEIKGSVTVDTFQSDNEIPIAESIDKLSIQVVLIVIVYVITYWVTVGLTSGLSAISPGLGNTVNTLLWGFNFMIGSGLAILTRVLLNKFQKKEIIHHQYQNNYLLSRISGLAFDIMIVAGLATIDLQDLSGLWLPFILMCVAGALVTLIHLKYVCKKVYPDYYYEGLVSMYGMMTGTISSGVLLLREIDPQMKTPAANNLVVGSSFAILFGIPLLVFVGLAARSLTMSLVTLGCVTVYYILLLMIAKGRKK